MDYLKFLHAGLAAWVKETAELCQPDKVELFDGEDASYGRLCALLIESGTFRKLSQELRPNSFLAESDPADTARVEERTFICSREKDEAGPTNNWVEPQTMKARMKSLFAGSMSGRTMYVVPYSMGPVGSSIARIGVELTDSAYVVVNMRAMTRTGLPVLKTLGKSGEFVRCLHSCGHSEKSRGKYDKTWPCDPERMAIVHFPEERMVWSYGSGYGGNALLNKKCFALRLASDRARDEVWLAEHMMIVGVTNPEEKRRYFAGAFPSACGKTNLAMLQSCLPGWKVETVGDDIAWMRFGGDGRLYAINAEAGFFGVAPYTSAKSNFNAMRCMDKDTIFTNVALTPQGDVWWEGIGWDAPEGTIGWDQGMAADGQAVPVLGQAKPLAHPNSRFTARASNCPSIDANWDNPTGVPISGIIFGGRRSTTVPLVYEARSWSHGVFVGSTLSSETTAAAAGQVGKLRRDPFAMLPFCGYNIGDYFAHWLSFGNMQGLQLPRIYQVNWFRKGEDGKFLWPGYSNNLRVLKWMFERCEGSAGGVDTPVGFMPSPGDIDTEGLGLSPEKLEKCLEIHKEDWMTEVALIRTFLLGLGDRVPNRLFKELAYLVERLGPR
ncbi:MAG: phosphoenolpyruvate carboxykinase (GTP) [Spirochaetes bacterium]|nr:phosphoenolpyruvate carboxykinase (GTP) [Spirochaetota bacterium]